jgi:phospholipase C
VVSPWVARGGVDHTLYDHSSVLATLARLFNIKPLTDRDRHANDLLPLLTDTCRTDCPQRIGA